MNIPLKNACHTLCNEESKDQTQFLVKLSALLEINHTSSDTLSQSLPFSLNDTTAGVENELQAVVKGNKDDVDLPITIKESSYYKNILKRAASGDTSQHLIKSLDEQIEDNRENVWDNSWVRFPCSVLSSFAQQILDNDLLADKTNPSGPTRSDSHRFFFKHKGEKFIRIPISYFLKLTLADVLTSSHNIYPPIRTFGERLMVHFSNDNTSPETFSFYPVQLKTSSGMGKSSAQETLRRFLLCQLLTMYGNNKFRLSCHGQKALVFFASHPPTRQKLLNNTISDSFYREIFMSPCLSGWDRGEEKFQYMALCHQVLSRSQLNAVAKLKEAGIITSNLIVLPNISNISLANNSTHISLGSIKLTNLLKNRRSGFTEHHEKYLGDLVIKITEHFLPLFVGAYSAAPYRLDFTDFHPERALGFLPHELDFTHLRMMWRRWKKKARLKFLGYPITPFGPEWFDSLISKILCLRGDFVSDFRVIDYLIALMSTDQSPALNGIVGNDIKLRQDLASLGVFDSSMSLYLLCRLRQFSTMGFSGFEGRYYSLFESLIDDMSKAVNLQTLITALANKYIFTGKISHNHIPDSPCIESERRQIFFGAAIGIPTFYIHKDTPNAFMSKILQKVKKTRSSHRYPGYLRVYNLEYRRALIEIIKEDAPELVELLGLKETIINLENRLKNIPDSTASSRLTQGILDEGGSKNPMKMSAEEFNMTAERYYRSTLRKKHILEALELFEDDIERINRLICSKDNSYRHALKSILKNKNASDFLKLVKNDCLQERLSTNTLRKLIYLLLLTINFDKEQTEVNDTHETSVY